MENLSLPTSKECEFSESLVWSSTARAPSSFIILHDLTTAFNPSSSPRNSLVLLGSLIFFGRDFFWGTCDSLDTSSAHNIEF